MPDPKFKINLQAALQVQLTSKFVSIIDTHAVDDIDKQAYT